MLLGPAHNKDPIDPEALVKGGGGGGGGGLLAKSRHVHLPTDLTPES